MGVRSSTWVTSLLILFAVGVVALVVPAPVVALGPGPTFDTLGEAQGEPVLTTGGLPTFPTTGHLNITTVQVTDGITTFQALGFWAASDHQLVPRFLIYQPGQTEQQISDKNQAAFDSSVTNAEAAALNYLRLPTRVTVAALTANSPSTGALTVGDEILAVIDRPVTSQEGVLDALRAAAPGQPIVMQIRRGGRTTPVTVVPGSHPDDPRRAFLGVQLCTSPVEGRRLAIRLAEVGGPSAGLMFTLGLVDKLTPGALTGGRFVAGTGTITPAGVVGGIDGIEFKMLRAREVGATVFLVPAENCSEAAAQAPDGLRLISVRTLTDAVSALDALRTGRTPPTCS